MIIVISVTKDDYSGIKDTVFSTQNLRKNNSVRQIIVDSSQENISQKVKRMVDSNQNLVYKWIEPTGISNAFNYGLKMTKENDWVWFLNGGDLSLLSEDKFDLFNFLQSTKSDVLIFSHYSGNNLINHPPIQKWWPPVFNWIPHPSVIAKASVLKRIKGFDTGFKIAMDGELWFRLFNLSDINTDVINIPISKFSAGGISENQKDVAFEVIKIYRKNILKIINDWFHYNWNLLRAFYYHVKNAIL